MCGCVPCEAHFRYYRMNEFSEKRHGKLALQNINLFSLIVKEGVREEAISLGLQVILKGYLKKKKQTNKQTNKQKNKNKSKNNRFHRCFFFNYGRLTAVFTAYG